jgi:phosphate starvation-inducible protein PhoH
MRNKSKRSYGQNRSFQDITTSLHHINPLNENQAKVINSDKNLVLVGFAGTGKTYLASYIGYRDMLESNGRYDKMVYMRSAVPTRNIGFLPGNEKEKVEVYEAPYIDIATELFGRGDSYEIMKKKGVVHFTSTSFVRGINLRNAIVIVDECQNMTYHELDSIITRLNDNCRIIFCGDMRQADLYKNGLEDFFNVLRSMNEFDFVEFQKEDIVRSELVKNYIIRKDEVLNIR